MATGEDVGVLVGRLIADTEGLRRDMARAQQTVATNTAKMNRALQRVDRAVGSIRKSFSFFATGVGAAAIAMGARFVKAQLDAAGALLDTSKALGFQTDSLQVLRHAAVQYNVAQTTLDMGLQRFSRRVGEAVHGQGELAATLREYKIAVTNADGSTRANEAILRDFADALKGAKSEQEKLRIAMKAFDSEGARPMVLLLADGAAGLDTFAREAHRLGLVLDESMLQKAKQASIDFNVLANVLRTQTLVAVTENAAAFQTLASAGMAAATGIARGFSAVGNTLGIIAAAGAAIARGDFAGAAALLSTPVSEMADPSRGAGSGGAAPGAVGTGGGFPAPSFGTAGGGGGGGLPPLAGGGSAMPPYLQAMLISMDSIPAKMGESMGKAAEAFAEGQRNMTAALGEQVAKRHAIEFQAQQAMDAARTMSANYAVGLLQAIGSKHRGAAIAALAIQKALAIKEILIQSQVAAIRAMAELGPIAGPPVAKALLVAGKVSAGLVAATGLAEALQISKGGGGPGLTSAQPLFTQGAGGTLSSTGQAALGAAGGARATQVIVTGNIYNFDDFKRAVTLALREESDRDVIFIRNNTRQAQEILRGGG